MPRTDSHWRQLEEAGFRSRFSCCYPQEEVFAPIPDHWVSQNRSLPDHREQEDLQASVLGEALHISENLIQTNSPLYVHCFAGRERSSLIAVGLTARQKSLDVFTALEWVRRSHPSAAPLYTHLVILERVLQEMI
jgi:protein-tyrosine phosphatase